MTPSNIEQVLTEIFAPAIDAKAPYAKVMFQKAALEIANAYNSEIDPMRTALRTIKTLGEEGMKPDYTEWLTFHDKVAQIATAALR
jgi:hypothetical protein